MRGMIFIMIKKHINELCMEKFSKYGTYSNVLNPKGVKFGEEPVEFYRDIIKLPLGNSNLASFSLCRLLKRPLIIDASEYHNYTGEMIIPLDGDILMHVGPATSNAVVPVEDIEIFRIPKGVVVCINPGVWHYSAFVYRCNIVNILVTLPERTYMNDCYVVEIPVEKQIEIVDE